jgi:hypothetical protein
VLPFKDPGPQTVAPQPSQELDRMELSLEDRIRALQDEVLSHPPTGLKADKAFYDWLCGEED